MTKSVQKMNSMISTSDESTAHNVPSSSKRASIETRHGRDDHSRAGRATRSSLHEPTTRKFEEKKTGFFHGENNYVPAPVLRETKADTRNKDRTR